MTDDYRIPWGDQEGRRRRDLKALIRHAQAELHELEQSDEQSVLGRQYEADRIAKNCALVNKWQDELDNTIPF